ncbi:kinetoplast-associated protein, partial [Trypanosoma rangeli]
PKAVEAAAPKSNPKLAFLFDNDAAHGGAAPEKQEPGSEVPVTDAAAAGVTHIEEVKQEPIENPCKLDDSGSAAATSAAPAAPSRRAMTIAKSVKLQRKLRDFPYDKTGISAAVENAEALATNDASLNSAKVQVDVKEARQPRTDDVTVPQSPTAPTDNTQHEISGAERHEHPADNASKVPNEEFKQEPAAVMSKSLKRSRYLKTCEAATQSLITGETHAQPHGEEETTVRTAVVTKPKLDLAQQPQVCNDQPMPPHVLDQIRAVGNIKTAAISRHAFTKLTGIRRNKKLLAKKTAMQEEAENTAAPKGAEEEAERRRAAEEEAERRRAAEEGTERKRVEEEAARKKTKRDAYRKPREEAARKKAEEEAARRKARREARER